MKKTRLSGCRFIDLFAGIGGIAQGFYSLGAECVFTSEINKFARHTYCINHHSSSLCPDPAQCELINRDITQTPVHSIPRHDVLLAGFPCQAFSMAGLRRGFEDPRGKMWFYIAEILKHKKPRAFLLENVRHIQTIGEGLVFNEILKQCRDYGYRVEFDIIDARPWVPQRRPRMVIVGMLDDTCKDFSLGSLQRPPERKIIKDILHPENGKEKAEEPYTLGEYAEVNTKYTVSEKVWACLQRHKLHHRSKGNGFGYNIVDPDDAGYTLSARYHKDGAENLITNGNSERPRRLTPRECARLMGFNDTFKIPVSDTQAYQQFGNSVAVPLFSDIAKMMSEHLIRN